MATFVALVVLALAVQIQAYMSSLEDERILFLLPKVELHAHLHGSMRLSTIIELAKEQSISMEDIDTNQISLEVGFKLFGIAHKVISTAQLLRRVFTEVIHDYMTENTIYLELRTTPRPLPDGTSIDQYVHELVTMIKQHNEVNADKMLIRLILSIDRSKPFTNAAEILRVALSYKLTHSSPIVGLDFSGNPYGVGFMEFVDLFKRARDEGLKVTVHTAEIGDSNTNEDETTSILKFR